MKKLFPIKNFISLLVIALLSLPAFSRTNVAPTVNIITPGPLSIAYLTPATVQIEAAASDSDGTIAQVEFYANGAIIGTVTSSPYAISWTNMAIGTFSVTAVATDNGGLSTTSAPVSITIIEGSNTALFSFLSFTASYSSAQVKLDWSTTNASNTSSFNVERSADGVSFSSLSTVGFQPMSGSILSYSYNDLAPLAGSNYYRIKRISTISDISYSDVTYINNLGAAGFGYLWTGSNSADWNNASNWSGGQVPNGISAAVTIDAPSGNSFQPIIPSGTTIKVNSLSIARNAILTDNGSLQIAGKLTNKGRLISNGQLSFIGNSTSGNVFKVTNPFSYSLDWSKVYAMSSNSTNVENYCTYRDPSQGRNGGYVTVTASRISNTVSGSSNTMIPAGADFFVTAKAGISSPILVVSESSKGNYEIYTSVPVDQQPRVDVLLYFYNIYGTRKVADGTVALFDDAWCSCVDGNDAVQMANWDEDISFARENKSLSIETRPWIVNSDTLFIHMKNMNVQGYEWQMNPTNWDNIIHSFGGITAELVDNYTGIKTPLPLYQNTVVAFNVTSAPGSAAFDRFYILFTPTAPLPLTLNSIKGYQKNGGINIDWEATQEQNVDRYEIEKSGSGVNFIKIASVSASGNMDRNRYSFFDATPVMGPNYYRLKMIDKDSRFTYSQVVKVVLANNVSAISVYPNPVTGNATTLQMTNIAKGAYQVTLMNSSGQIVYSKSLNHTGGSATENIKFEKQTAPGMYHLQLTGENGKYSLQLMKQ